MKTRNISFRSVLSAFLMAAAGASPTLAFSADGGVESIVVRGKAGAGYYSNLAVSPTEPGWVFGGDIGFYLGNNFGLIAEARILNSVSTGLTMVESRYFGLAPAYLLSKGAATISASLGLGALNYTVTQMQNGVVGISGQAFSRFAVVPGMNLDVDVLQGGVVSVGVQYLVGLGGAPSPGLFLPTVGAGWRF